MQNKPNKINICYLQPVRKKPLFDTSTRLKDLGSNKQVMLILQNLRYSNLLKQVSGTYNVVNVRVIWKKIVNPCIPNNS